MTYGEWKQIADEVGELEGWDFGRMRTDRDPVPWEYLDVVRAYLRPEQRVLDIGTGGGERFSELAPSFAHGIGIDHDAPRIAHARANVSPTLRDRLVFVLMAADRLDFEDASFDLVLDRHAPYTAAEVARVLRPGGSFITQQVAPGNMGNLAREFGGGTVTRTIASRARETATWDAVDCDLVAWSYYDVRYFVQDIPSLVFWLNAVCNPDAMDVAVTFDIDQHYQVMERIVERYTTPRGIRTNERRTLLIVRKRDRE